MNGTSFDYRLVPVHAMQAFIAITEVDGYIAEDQTTGIVRALLAEGFRWVRSEDGFAVLERQTQKADLIAERTLDLLRPKPQEVGPEVDEAELDRRVEAILADAANCTSYEEEIASLVRRLMEAGQ